MKVKITAQYGKEGFVSRLSKPISIPSVEVDECTYQEALDYVTDHVIEPWSSEGYDLEDDEDSDVGYGLLASWVISDIFGNRKDALQTLEEILDETNSVLEELE